MRFDSPRSLRALERSIAKLEAAVPERMIRTKPRIAIPGAERQWTEVPESEAPRLRIFIPRTDGPRSADGRAPLEPYRDEPAAPSSA